MQGKQRTILTRILTLLKHSSPDQLDNDSWIQPIYLHLISNQFSHFLISLIVIWYPWLNQGKNSLLDSSRKMKATKWKIMNFLFQTKTLLSYQQKSTRTLKSWCNQNSNKWKKIHNSSSISDSHTMTSKPTFSSSHTAEQWESLLRRKDSKESLNSKKTTISHLEWKPRKITTTIDLHKFIV